jgi:hypothetical protein
MELKEILEIDIGGKNVLIIGCPASGKTWLCGQLGCSGHRVIHTDKYVVSGYEMGMYAALNDAVGSEIPTIVEGIHGYRMLRKGAEYGSYYPDIVIEMKVPEQRMRLTYIHERNPNKIKYLQQFNATHEKILNDYRKMIPDRLKPQWIVFENNY